MIDRSVSSEEFSFNGSKRRRGVAVHSDKIFGGKVDYLFGIYNHNFVSDNENNTMLYIARTSYYPFGPYESYIESDLEYTETFKAHIGGGMGFQQSGANSSSNAFSFADNKDEVDQTQLLAEFGFKYKGMSLSGEYHNRKRKLLDALDLFDVSVAPGFGAIDKGEALHDQGFFVQGGYFVIPKKLEVTGRCELIDADKEYNGSTTVGIGSGDANYYTTGLNYFLNGRDHKVQLNYRYVDQKDGSHSRSLGSVQNEIIMQYQIYF